MELARVPSGSRPKAVADNRIRHLAGRLTAWTQSADLRDCLDSLRPHPSLDFTLKQGQGHRALEQYLVELS